MSITKSGSFSGVKPNERDSVPFHWKRTQLVPDISWKYHHIIPWQTLRDTWQALLMCDYWKGCVLYVKVIGVDRPAFRRHPVAIIDGNDRGVYGQQQAVHR